MCNIQMFYIINFKQRYAKVWRCTSEKGIIVRFFVGLGAFFMKLVWRVVWFCVLFCSFSRIFKKNNIK